MDIPWWIWPVGVYLAASSYFSVLILRTDPKRLPDKNNRPPSKLVTVLAYGSAFVVLILIWPYILWWDWRHRDA